MTISPSGSWIWQNGHRRWIQNAQNSREPAWLGWKWVRNRLNRSENRFWTLGGSLGLNREYSGEYSIGSAEAKDRLNWRLGSAGDRLEYGARGRHSSSTSGARGWDWATVTGISGGAWGSPRAPMKLIFAPVSSYGWALHCGMIKNCFWQLWKFVYLPKYLCFVTNEALIPIVGGRNHWWWLWNTQKR